jgi:hypothetical protein
VDGTWTIAELAERASTVLAAGGQGQVSGRVREAPNDRLIRWYGTIGLVDPPLSRTGRVARYGRRHLLQLVAVKRRQADGRSLADIQAELVGATDAYLESVAGLPPDDAAVTTAAGRPAPRGPAHEARFWAAAARPSPASRFGTATAAFARAAGPEPQSEPEPHPAEPERQAADLVQGLRLAPGVVLLLDAGPSALPATAVAELTAAAEPLIRVLAQHGYPTGTDDQERKRT